MIPVQKIEVWHGGSLLHTITDALSIRVREVLTDAVGTFKFAVATKKNGDYLYNDINVYDTVKIWIDYDSVGATPLTVGKIYRISAPLKTKQGYLRLFYGKNQGEILERRVKGRKAWSGTAASTIVTELANDLGLGTSEIEADTTAVTLTTDVDTYFDLLKKLSDYWYDAGNQVKKDFYVDVNNNLVWKSRPLRTTGVETLSVGEEILSYILTHDATQLKNNITVYGKREVYNPSKYGQTAKVQNPTVHGYTHPSDGDSWTWTSGWQLLLAQWHREPPTQRWATTTLKPPATQTATGSLGALFLQQYTWKGTQVFLCCSSGVDVMFCWKGLLIKCVFLRLTPATISTLPLKTQVRMECGVSTFSV